MLSLKSDVGSAVRHPLHHDPAGGQVVAPGLVVLLGRDDRGARALDRGRRVGQDDVEAFVRQLEVIAAVGDDHPAVGVGQHGMRRRGSSSRTSRARSGRARRRRCRRPAISALRNAEPMPKATTSARVASGRAMSGRIGISFASMVSSVIDVPATQSSGVKVIWPAWTDAISSSVEAKSWPPSARCRPRSAGPGRPAGARRRRSRRPPPRPRWRSASRRRRNESPAERDPERGVDRREAGDQDR